MSDRPEFSHKRERHGVIGPFSGRQLVLAFTAVLVAVVVLVGVTTPLGTTAGPGTVNPRATAYIISSPPPVGLQVGATAPEFATTEADGSTYQLTDLDGKPSGWPTCAARLSGSTSGPRGARRASPRSRSCATSHKRYKDRGLALVAISVQETSPADRGGLRSPLPAPLHHRVRRLRQDLPRVQGVRPADPGLHRPERRDRQHRRGAPRRGRCGPPTSRPSCRRQAGPRRRAPAWPHRRPARRAERSGPGQEARTR